MNIESVKLKSEGRWPDIMKTLGIEIGDGKHRPCPVCGGEKPFRFDDKDGRGTWICTHDGAGDGFKLVQLVKRVDFKGAIDMVGGVLGVCEVSRKKPTANKNAAHAIKELLKSSKKVRKGDYVSRYLLARGLSVIPPHLGISKCWESETKREQIAMLAVFSGCDGKMATVHRTYLTSDGRKLDVQSPRKIMPVAGKMSGGAVRLFDFESGSLGICEGIETAIAAHEIYGIPVWAALSATLLKQFEPPENVSGIYIFADNDLNYTGHAAAYGLANRLSIKSEKLVRVIVPERDGMDFLDVLNEKNGGTN